MNEHLENIEESKAETATEQQAITIRVPASIANFGPGFETIALAVKMYLNLTVRVQAPRPNRGIEIITKGEIAPTHEKKP